MRPSRNTKAAQMVFSIRHGARLAGMVSNLRMNSCHSISTPSAWVTALLQSQRLLPSVPFRWVMPSRPLAAVPHRSRILPGGLWPLFTALVISALGAYLPCLVVVRFLAIAEYCITFLCCLLLHFYSPVMHWH